MVSSATTLCRFRWHASLDNVNPRCCILNTGPGAWAFAEHAQTLSRTLAIDISETPRDFNYVLGVADDTNEALASLSALQTFIPWAGIRQAGDKRLLATAFNTAGVATPVTHLTDTPDDVWRLIASDPSREWCLKYPTGCAAAGHRLIKNRADIPDDWPRPYVVQEFVRLDRPEVYRLYAAGGQTLGWNVRRFPAGSRTSPWVAHARGARYAPAGDAPPEAVRQATLALRCTHLFDSFGCADLIRRPSGEWLVLEVGTDGVYNHVDRDLGNPALIDELNDQVARAFWRWVDAR